MEWYIARNGESSGPYSSQQLREFARQSTLSPDDQVCKAGGDWVLANRIKGLQFTVPNSMADQNEADVMPEFLLSPEETVGATELARFVMPSSDLHDQNGAAEFLASVESIAERRDAERIEHNAELTVARTTISRTMASLKAMSLCSLVLVYFSQAGELVLFAHAMFCLLIVGVFKSLRRALRATKAYPPKQVAVMRRQTIVWLLIGVMPLIKAIVSLASKRLVMGPP